VGDAREAGAEYRAALLLAEKAGDGRQVGHIKARLAVLEAL
jgi:hypothetical protein